MKARILFLTTLCAVLLISAFAVAADEAIEPKKEAQLFNGKNFDGWVRHLGGNQGNPDETWTVKPGGVLACTGRPSGYIRTENSYKNYKLRLEYRWTGKTGNNGVLVHMTGEDTVWPKSLECQGMFHNQGDFFEIGGFEFNEHKSGGYRVGGRKVKKLGEHNEKEAGEWNVYEIYAVGDTVRPYVNGKLMNEASGCAITEGKICLQSEGAPIEFRNITIAPATDKPWPVVPKKKIVLFNGKDLDGWIGFLPDDKRGDDKKFETEKNWSVADGLMRCEGKMVGYIRTVDKYADYKLHVEWRWPEKPANSGVLLHRQGIDQSFPLCIEAQLKSGSAGDLVMMSGGALTVDGKDIVAERFAQAKKTKPSNEKAGDGWNSYDIVSDGGALKIVVNGELQNAGVNAKPASGQICLQSEGGPVEFRNVYIEPLD